jgi:peptide/bleomycin uptake transporter
MFKYFFWSKKWFAWAYGGSAFLILISWLTVKYNVKYNDWYKSFYDLLGKPAGHAKAEFFTGVIAFFLIVVQTGILRMVTRYVAQIYALRWREALTTAYIPLWLSVGRSDETEGASQRIHEDPKRLAVIFAETLGLKFIEAILSLIAFLPILDKAGAGITLPIVGNHHPLLWLTGLICTMGLGITWLVGIKLPKLDYANQRVEAAFRKLLVHAEDNKSLLSAERAFELFTGVRQNYQKMFLQTGYLNFWESFFSSTRSILLFLVLAPSLFEPGSSMSIGIILSAEMAFYQVSRSLTLLTDEWEVVAELFSILRRLKEFERTLPALPVEARELVSS